MTDSGLKLVLLRHAKSSWDAPGPDHERPLSARGRNQAPIIGKKIANLNFNPEFALVSDAKRTQETWEFAGLAFEPTPDSAFSSELYAPSLANFQNCGALIPAGISSAMLISHNPGIESFVEFLSNQQVLMKTSNAALLTFHSNPGWSQAFQAKGQWQLVDILKPGI